jgi:PAS domain S-box-containing protein
LLEALPGPAWIVECSTLQVLRCNAAASAISANAEFVSIFPAGLDEGLLGRLRSAQPQIGFHASFKGEHSPWLFSAALLPGTVGLQRLILAQPAAVFDVPAQLTFDELLNSVFDGIMILNAERRIVQINLRFQQMFGYSIEELLGKLPEILAPAGYESEFVVAHGLLDRGGIYQQETRRLRRDGSLLEVQVSSQPIVSGRFRGGIVVIYHDCTDSKRQSRYDNLRLEATRILAQAATVEQASTELLPVIAESLGWDVVRLWRLGEGGLECVRAHTAAGSSCWVDARRASAPCTAGAKRVAREGRSEWFSDLGSAESSTDIAYSDGALAAFPIVDAQKQVVGVLELLASHKPLPESAQRELLDEICANLGQFIIRCKAERALAENEAKFRTLAETAPIAIFIHVNGVILYVNAASELLFGYSREELASCSLWPMVHPEDMKELQERASRRMRGEEFQKRWEARMIRKDGEVRWVDCSAALITLGNRPAILCVATDITDRRALAIQLEQTQKMEAIGRLAGGIAHDFNNVLMVIGGCGEVISLSENLPEDVLQAATEIKHAADRAAALTRQLLVFSRHQVLAPRMVDLNSAVSGTELILRRLLGDDIVLQFDLEPGLGSILADSSQIEQVVMNLAVNARHAMPKGGKLSICVSSAFLDENALRAGARSGSYAVLTVTDNGVGMSPEIQQHIFEPFFTTKGAGKGTGLGLSTVYGIVKQSSGFITVESKPQRGATFKIFFPVAGAAAAAVAESASKSQEPALTGSHTILLVEDEPEVRALLHGSLSRDGHTVVEASGGVNALEVSSAYSGKIDLLLTDVVMSGMSGRDLADRLLLIRPGLKVLYVSGYNEDTVLQKGVIEGQMEFLQKPFSLSALSRTVRQILSR